ncbi:MAG: hypothetical protein PXY39_05695 [archaeon]|nr:hypothetical protein [archaeon]
MDLTVSVLVVTNEDERILERIDIGANAGMFDGIAVSKLKEDFEAAWKELSISEQKCREAHGFHFEDYETEQPKFYSGEESA